MEFFGGNFLYFNMKTKTAKKIPADIFRHAQNLLDEMMYLFRPYLVVLTPPERRNLFEIGTESLKFLEMSHGIAVDYPEMFPSIMEVAAFREEFFNIYELHQVSGKIDQLKNVITDTKMLAGRNTLDTALVFYNTVKIAARHDIPGARQIYEELKPAFKSGVQKQKKPGPGNDRRQPELFAENEIRGLRRNF